MVKPVNGNTPLQMDLSSTTVEDLLLLVGDQDLGLKPEAMRYLLSLGLVPSYPILESALRNDANDDLRNGAMEVLVGFGEEAVPFLIKLLNDENEEVRNFCAVMLGDIGSRLAIDPLINALRDPDLNVSHAAAEALGKIGDDAALLPLIRLLHGDFWLQYPAVVAIGEMADVQALPHLIPLLDNEMLREPTITALGKIGSIKALVPLVQMLNNPDGQLTPVVGAAILEIIERGGQEARDELKATVDQRGREELLQYLAGNNMQSKGAVITLLGFLGEDAALPALVYLLADHDYRHAAKKAITAMASATSALMEALFAEGQKNQAPILKLLRNLKAEIPVERLLLLYHQGTPEVQQEVLVSLAGATSPEVISLVEQLLENGHVTSFMTELAAKICAGFPSDCLVPVCRRLSSSADPQKRAVAALVSGYAGGDSLSDLMSSLFADNEVLVRREAVKAAGKWKNRECISPLVAALTDPDSSIRAEAVFALAEFGEEAPVAQLLQQLGKQDERLDYEIIMAIGRIGSTGAEDPLAKYLADTTLSRHLEFAVIEILGRIGTRKGPAGKIVTRYLHHGDPDIRRLAIQALVNLGAEDYLEQVLTACSDPHWSVRVVALQELGRMGSEQHLSVVAAALADPDNLVRQNAVMALAKSGTDFAVRELVKNLADPELGRYAKAALAEMGKMYLPLLHQLAESDAPLPIRQGIISILARFDDEKSMKILSSLSQGPVAEIREAAGYALMLNDEQARG